MKKRILSLAAVLAYAAVSVFGSNVFATQSASQTNVQPPSGSYVKKVIIDDDFEDRTIGGKINASSATAYLNPLVSSGTAGQINGDESNKYYETTATSAYEKFYANSASYYADIDRLAISMDLTNPDALAGTIPEKTVANPVIYFNGTAMFRLNMNEKAAAQGLEVKFFSGTSEKNFTTESGTVIYTNKRAAGSKWNHIDMVLKRTLNSDNSTYSVELEKLNVNGNELYVGEKAYSATPNFTNADWWTSNTNSSAIFRFGNANLIYMIDNVLVYEPYADGEEPVAPEEPDESEVTTKVQKPAYLPKAGTIIVDESFDSSAVSGSNVTTGYQYGLKDFAQDTAGDLVTDGENKYGKFMQWGKVYSKVTGPVASDKFVVSLDAKSSAAGGGNIYFGSNMETLALRFVFSEITNDTDNWLLYLCNGSDYYNTRFAVGTTVPRNAFTKISVVCKKVNVEGVDKVILSEAYVNNLQLTLLDGTDTRYLASDWSLTPAGTSTVKIGNFSTEDGAAALDNIIAYTPLKFKASGAVLSDDGLTADITFNGTIGNIDSAAAAAVDMFGNKIDSTLTAEGSTLTATFDSPVNIQDKVYTFTVSGVKNSNGETADTLTAVYGTGIASIDYENAEVKINNNLETAIDGNFIVAAYDSSNNFLGATAAAVNVPVNKLGTVSNVTLPTTSGTPAKYRLFIWSKDSIMPYCGGTEVSAQ